MGVFYLALRDNCLTISRVSIRFCSNAKYVAKRRICFKFWASSNATYANGTGTLSETNTGFSPTKRNIILSPPAFEFILLCFVLFGYIWCKCYRRLRTNICIFYY